jgi:hypothetical protein
VCAGPRYRRICRDRWAEKYVCQEARKCAKSSESHHTVDDLLEAACERHFQSTIEAEHGDLGQPNAEGEGAFTKPLHLVRQLYDRATMKEALTKTAELCSLVGTSQICLSKPNLSVPRRQRAVSIVTNTYSVEPKFLRTLGKVYPSCAYDRVIQTEARSGFSYLCP